MIKKYIYLKCKIKNKNRLLLKLYKNNINVYDIIYKNNEIYIKVLESDEAKINKIYGYKFYYYSDSGIFKLKKEIPFIQILEIIMFIFWVNFFSSFIYEVQVIHSNKDIRELVRLNLEERGIKRLNLKKDFNEIEQIKEEIKNLYKDQIEWLEIENVGMKYIVRIEERIINNYDNSPQYCHIVAKKSGVIESIVATEGEVLVHDGKYVTEGEILISGEILKDTEIKNNVCATGQVLAEVWYTTKVSLPLNYVDQQYTGKKRLNLRVKSDTFNYKIFKSRLNNYVEEEQKLFDFFGLSFYKITEREVISENESYTMEEGLAKAQELADEKVNLKLQEPEHIKLRKVLKKSLNNSTIDVELFYVVIEDITNQVEYQIELKDGSLDDTRNTN